MKLYETLQIVERVAWCEDWETEGENKSTKWENSRNRYGYMVCTLKKQLLVSGRNSAM